jgi:tRNA U34 2-thiouridine synthase MnmA/TrmU
LRALVLLSGGLDSILAVKLLQKQQIEVTGLTFVSYFFDADLAKKAAKNLGIKLKIIDFSDEHLAMVKKPKYGYGQAMNPCIDCHILMLKKAKEVAGLQGLSLRDSPQRTVPEGQSFDLVATGEVLGERPMSQNKQALELIEKESSLKGYLLRPLSAKLLEPTIPEKKGLVDRNKLLNISGRSRKRQMALAKKWGIKEYPTPAGGCLLTDLQFGQRLKELFQQWPDCQGNDVRLLKLGRHFWVKDNKIIVGRNHQENLAIKELTQKGDMLIEPKDFPGPTILIRGRPKILPESLIKAKELMIRYSPKLKSINSKQ